MVVLVKTPATKQDLQPLADQVADNTASLAVIEANYVSQDEFSPVVNQVAENTANIVTLDNVVADLETSLVNTVREVKLLSVLPSFTLASPAETKLMVNNTLHNVYGDFTHNTFVNYSGTTGEFTLIGTGVVTFKLNYNLDKLNGGTGDVTIKMYGKRGIVTTLIGEKVVHVTTTGINEDISYNNGFANNDVVWFTYQTASNNIVLAGSGLAPAVDIRITQVGGGVDLSNYYTKVEADNLYVSKIQFSSVLKAQIGEIIMNLNPAHQDLVTYNDGVYEYLLCNGQGFDALAYPELAIIYGSAVPDFHDGTVRNLPPESTRNLGDYQDFAIENITGTFNFGNLGPLNGSDGVFRSQGSGVGPSNVGSGYFNGSSFDASRVVKTADETRMANIAVQFYVKAKVLI